MEDTDKLPFPFELLQPQQIQHNLLSTQLPQIQHNLPSIQLSQTQYNLSSTQPQFQCEEMLNMLCLAQYLLSQLESNYLAILTMQYNNEVHYQAILKIRDDFKLWFQAVTNEAPSQDISKQLLQYQKMIEIEDQINTLAEHISDMRSKLLRLNQWILAIEALYKERLKM
jgi:hypothetical protein